MQQNANMGLLEAYMISCYNKKDLSVYALMIEQTTFVLMQRRLSTYIAIFAHSYYIIIIKKNKIILIKKTA